MSQFDKLKDALLLGGTRSSLHCFPGTVDYEKVGCTVCACLNTIVGFIGFIGIRHRPYLR